MFTTTTFTAVQVTEAVRLGVAAAAVVALTGLAGCANNDASSVPGVEHGSSSSAPAVPSSSAAAPTASGTPAAGPHNDADVIFLTMMIPHHQQAIGMGDMLFLAKDGIDPAVTELDRQIKDAQALEITQMSGWLAGWGPIPSPSLSGMDHGGGTTALVDMEVLEKSSGAEVARLFLTSMVKHHKGAIAMARTEVTDGQNPEAKELARSIITSRKAEIEQMNTLLARL